MQIERDFILDPSLVFYLPLYELDGASFMSRDAYGHKCMVTGAVWKPNGRYFDGSDDTINCGDPGVLNMNDVFTLEFYLKAPLPTGYIVDKSQWQQKGWYVRQVNTNGAVLIRLDNAGNETSILSSNGRVQNDEWTHIVIVVKNGEYVDFHFNGEYDKRVTTSFLYVAPTGRNLYIGAENGSANFLRGSIGEIRIYHRALTTTEIQRNYLSTKWRYK